jgi:hypothetical protein
MVKDPDELGRAILIFIYVEILFLETRDKPALSVQDSRVQHNQTHIHRYGGVSRRRPSLTW